MSDFYVSRPGQANATGSATAVFLEVFSGLVLEAFDKAQVTMDRHLVRTISSGYTAQFPVFGTASASAHTPGVELTGQAIRGADRNIAVEFLLTADVFVANIDEAMAHFDVKSIYAHQLGQALANAFDANVFRSIYLASEVADDALFTGSKGGLQLTDAAMATDVSVLKAAIFDAAQGLDEESVPGNDRYLAVRPAQFYLLLQDGEFINRDYSGEGSKARAAMPFASDLQVLKSNNIPSSVDTSNTNIPSNLRATYAPYIAAVWGKSAAGTTKLLDLKTETEYSARHQGTLLVAKYAMGHGILQTEAAVTLATS